MDRLDLDWSYVRKWYWINEVWIFAEEVVFDFKFSVLHFPKKIRLQICRISKAWNIDIFLAQKVLKVV